ncbi:hypothetical protein LXL04_027203 [Taraxacum kok-saghyz]
MAVLTSIWSIRNGAVFDNKKVVVDTEFCRIKELVFFWLRSRNRKFKMELNNWISNPKHNMALMLNGEISSTPPSIKRLAMIELVASDGRYGSQKTYLDLSLQTLDVNRPKEI